MSYIAKRVLSYKISTGTEEELSVKVYNPGYDIKIARHDPTSMWPIVEKVPDGINTLLLPNPTESNACILKLGESIPSDRITDMSVHADMYADGAVIDKGEAFAITSADCPTIVVYGRDKAGKLFVCAAHASRESLLDRESILHGYKFRADFSVVYSALNRLYEYGVCVDSVHMHIYCGIRSGFTHPQSGGNRYSLYNRNLINYCNSLSSNIVLDEDSGEIDLYALIRAQAVDMGVPEQSVIFDDMDTYTDSLWASNRRDPGTSKRNLVIVSRKES